MLYISLRNFIRLSMVVLYGVIALGYLGYIEDSTLNASQASLCMVTGEILFFVQFIIVFTSILQATKTHRPVINEKNVEQTYSTCISAGILGTFIGFAIIFHEFSSTPASGARSSQALAPVFTPETYESIMLALATSISGILLATVYDISIDTMRRIVSKEYTERQSVDQKIQKREEKLHLFINKNNTSGPIKKFFKRFFLPPCQAESCTLRGNYEEMLNEIKNGRSGGSNGSNGDRTSAS